MGRLPFEEFKSIFSKVPRVTIEIVLVKNGGVVLTLRNIDPYKGYWHTPGGTLFYKEKVEDAVKRIAKDELGVEVKINKFLGYWEVPEWTQENGFSHSIGLVYQVETLLGDFTLNNQSSKMGIFDKIPDNTIQEQKEFLEKLEL